MTQDDQPTAESILADAKLAGLPLTPEEAADMVKGVRRMKEMARSVRSFVDATTEPAPTFKATAPEASS